MKLVHPKVEGSGYLIVHCRLIFFVVVSQTVKILVYLIDLLWIKNLVHNFLICLYFLDYKYIKNLLHLLVIYDQMIVFVVHIIF